MKGILIVGGSFDAAGGRPSGLVNKIIQAVKSEYANVDFYNGGFVDELHNNILPSAINYGIVFWMPNVPNDEAKIRNVKEINPKTILISSKRNDNSKYAFSELINRALSQKSNLVIEFSRGEEKFNMRVFDPLGTLFYDGTDIDAMVHHTMKRADLLTRFTRVPSYMDHDYMIALASKENNPESVDLSKVAPEVPDEEQFFKFARDCSDIFHNLINPDKGVTRFLGNMSFRCQNGFPSFRKDNIIYVSRRNVDKRFINKDSFVPTYMDKDGNVRYYGEHKPSVDTPIQQRLYAALPQMNYMLHAHCYVNIKKDGTNTPFTFRPVPCGAIEEVEEILSVINAMDWQNEDFIAINLIGHGCILMAKSADMFDNLRNENKDMVFVSRNMPENITSEFLSDLYNHETPMAQETLTPDKMRYLLSTHKVTIVKRQFCCNGSRHACCIEEYRAGLMGQTQENVDNMAMKIIQDTINQNATDRVYYANIDGTGVYFIVLRDTNIREDYCICMNEEYR